MNPPTITDELMRTITDFVRAGNWDASQSIVEANQALLFTPKVTAVFEQNMIQARRISRATPNTWRRWPEA